jgi:hypothetical protein
MTVKLYGHIEVTDQPIVRIYSTHSTVYDALRFARNHQLVLAHIFDDDAPGKMTRYFEGDVSMVDDDTVNVADPDVYLMEARRKLHGG